MTRRRTGFVPAGLLIAAFFLQSYFSSRIKSPVFDEPPHIAAGLAYVQKDVFLPNPQHPPLIKELAASSLLAAGIALPDSGPTEAMLHEVPRQRLEWPVGNTLIADNGPPRVLFWARLPIIVMSTLLALLVYVWGRQLVGGAAALGALFLFVADPNLLGHSAFVTTDMGVAAFGTLFYFALWHYLRRPTSLRLVLSGIALGLCLGAKYSGILAILTAALLMAASESRGLRGVAPGRATIRRVLELGSSFLVMCFVAWLVIVALYRSPNGLSTYMHGLTTIYADAAPDFTAYMAGETAMRHYSYFAVAWLLKEPVGNVVLVLLGLAVILRNRAVRLPDKLFLFLPPAVLFAACTLRAANIGIRYIIPMLPFACLAGGAGLAYLFRSSSAWMRGLAALLSLWIVVAAAGIYPDNLSYFNEAACLVREPAKIGLDGGSKCGPQWLDDSNVDWGQGLVQLRKWLSSHPYSGAIHLAYFGSFPPAAYGIAAEPLNIGEFDRAPAPGVYVVSASFVARGRTSWLGEIPPTAIIGHALYLYDIR